MDKEVVSLLKNLLGSNGYVDEATGSWHRYVDAVSKQAEALSSIAESLYKIADKYDSTAEKI